MNSALPADTDEVSTHSEEFEDHELRKVFYDVAHQKRANGEIRDAIKIVLLGWNWRAYAGTDISNAELNLQIEEFIESNQRLLDYFAGVGHTLASVDFQYSLDGTSVENCIIENFNAVIENEAVSSTGASKAYHMLYPRVFMMWDTAIIEAYHQEGESRHWTSGAGQGLHASGEGECYLAFLKETQDFIRSELNMDRFPEKSPAKVMDEYNYAKYTL